jgi:predicted amidophosphoribosyltransferase
MAFKRALWTSGYTYRITCPVCHAVTVYNDKQLDFRPWFPDGFIYCHQCAKPLRHNEIYAINPDGTPVYDNLADARQSIRDGYYSACGIPRPQQPQNDYRFCTNCGRRYQVGRDHFCSGCGTKLD